MNARVGILDNPGATERRRIRTGAFTGPTSGLAPGNVQANLVILPRDLAHDFLRFAQANPRPCPVLAVSDEGSPLFPTLGVDLDIRTDLPRYRVWRDGELIEEPTSVTHVWQVYALSIVNGCAASAILSLQITYLQNLITDRPGLSSALLPMNGFVSSALRASAFALGTAITSYQGTMIIGTVMFLVGAWMVYVLGQAKTAAP